MLGWEELVQSCYFCNLLAVGRALAVGQAATQDSLKQTSEALMSHLSRTCELPTGFHLDAYLNHPG